MKLLFTVILLSTVVLKALSRQENEGKTIKPIKESTISPNPRRRQRSEFRDNEANPFFTRFGKKPKKKNLDRDYLIDLLGGSYDEEFLSEGEPEVLSEVSPPIELEQDVSVSWTAEHIHKELESLNLTNELLQVGGGEFVQDEKSLNVMKRWLLKKASCPVHYSWKDIGPYFWPRWLKKGECSLNGDNCSWPSGMYCTPAETTTVQVLRWLCSGAGYKGRKHRSKGSGTKTRGGGWRRGSQLDKKDRKCQWMKVPYPITSACMCRC